MKVEFSILGIDNVINALKSLPPSVVSKRGGPVRFALRKGATVIAKQERLNLQAQLKGVSDEGEKISTGLLLKSIIVSRGKPPTGGNGERYLIRIKNKRYERAGKYVSTLKTAQIKEYGSVNQPPSSFIRSAFNAKATEAIFVTRDDLLKRIDKIASQLLRGAK